MDAVGICIGATTLSAVAITKEENGHRRTEPFLKPHNGNPRKAFLEMVKDFGIGEGTHVAVTGRKFRQLLNLSSISEPEAVETALASLGGNGKINAVVSAGGETFLVYVIGGDGKISSIQTGNKCASGTGDFYVQQLRRMDISLEETAGFLRDEHPYRVSGRCSVFCKSDCTHALNKGIPKERISSGLCRMMAGKIIEILRQIPKRQIMVIGGTSKNKVMMEYLQEEISGLIVPEEAPYFEALGAGLWALGNETLPLPDPDHLFKDEAHAFHYLSPLAKAGELVDFRPAVRSNGTGGEDCILGLDVGSTTTKAVIMRREDSAVLASVYLRTNGDPVGASRACYAELQGQVERGGFPVRIIGLGVTGSGRQIAGLHAMTEGIINEIIAHAAAALFFDREVDTILEIGGQDAKYTYIVNGVPTDYAMNDACSAGTGSFLEEAAQESLGIAMEQIAGIALQGGNPPNFNDQCAAFISSDIKNASHEGIRKEDIVAGLVYSIAMNYNSRVRGNRPVGNKVFMQGGVCYNRAVPMAMAALTGKPIIVPPDPGLMGAFGVALEMRHRIELGLIQPKPFSLERLSSREIGYDPPFVCNGGREECDRKCEIARIRLEGKVYPFGGACNRWYNLRTNLTVEADKLDLVAAYEKRIFKKNVMPPGGSLLPEKAPVVGINKSFLSNLFYPLYARFFEKLGFRVRLSETMEQEGTDYKGAPFCYPAEIAHGYLFSLLRTKPDYLFIPQIKGLPVEGSARKSSTCPVCQGEPYYLRSAFKKHPVFRDLVKKGRVLEPVIDFSGGYEAALAAFRELGRKVGASPRASEKAYTEAVGHQRNLSREMKEEGARFMAELEKTPDRFAVVLLGRSYNAYVSETNMGIPHKFASRGIPIIPADFLGIEQETLDREMYWTSGQTILRGASVVAKHPQLFGCYITNFSCGPDSFLVGYVRDRMGRKPFLILELDSHVADAGLETRIEAFIDIIRNYRELDRTGEFTVGGDQGRGGLARFDFDRQKFIDSDGRAFDLRDPHVHLIIPSMGDLFHEAGAAVFRKLGIRTSALPPADTEVLKLGRGNTSCKECLPLQLTTGSLLKYLKDRPSEDEMLVYLMPTASGPCRFGQYSIFMNDLIARRGLRNVALMAPTAENSYIDLLTPDLVRKIFIGLIVADVMQDIHSVVLANAVEAKKAREVFQSQWAGVIRILETADSFGDVMEGLRPIAAALNRIPVKRTLRETPLVLLTGEIFVRSDSLSRQFLDERLAEHGLAAKVSGLMEWILYTDWCFQQGLSKGKGSIRERLSVLVRSLFMRRYEKEIKRLFAGTGLYPYKLDEVAELIRHTSHLISPQLAGEAILTVGSALNEVLDQYCGAIAIGPFGCMPNRVAEAVLTFEMNREGKISTGRKGARQMEKFRNLQELPFLAIESDGNPFPQIITAKLEAFMLQAGRVHREMVGRAGR